MSDFKVVSLLNPVILGLLSFSAGTESISAGPLVFSNSNNITFGMHNGTVTASMAGGGGGAAFSAGASNLGNTLGNTGTVSNQIVFAGTNNITLSQSTNAAGATVTISGPNVPSTVGLISNINVSAGTTSTNASAFTFSNSNGLSFGLGTGANVGVVTGSYTVPTVTNSSWTVSDSATSGTVGNLAFTNLNGVTLSLSTGAGGSHTIVGSHNALTSQSNQAFSASGGSSAFQTLVFTNSNGITWTNTAGSVAITHDLQYTSATSNITSNALNTSASRVFNVIAATNNAGGGAASLSSNVSFSNANGLTFYTSAGNAIVGSYTVPSVPAQTNQTVGLYAISNTTGQSSSSTIDARSFSIEGAGVASVGLSNGTFIVSVPSGGGAGDGGNVLAAGTRTATTLGTVLFANANGLTFGLDAVNGTQITGSYTVPSIAGLISAIGVTGSNGNFTTTGISFSNANGMSFGTSAGSAVTASYTVPSTAGLISNINISAGSTSTNASAFTFSNSNGLAFGLSSGAGAGVITGSYTVPTVTNSSWTVSDNATSGTVGRLAFTNLNGITLSLSTGAAGSHTIVGSHNAITSQTNQTVGIYGSSQTTGSASSGTYDARSLSIIGAGIISVGNHSTSVGGTTTGIIISATQSNQAFSASGGSSAFQTLVFTNSNGITWTNTAGSVAITHDLQFTSNTSNITSNALNTSASRVFNIVAATNNTGGGTASLSSNVSFSAANGLTFYTSAGSAIVGSYTVPTQTNQTVSLLVAGNTTGQSSASTFDARTFNMSGAGVASVGWSAGSLIVSVPSGGGAGDGFNIVSMLTSTSGGGTAGATFSTASGSIGLMAGSNITLSQTSNTIVINGPAAGGGYTQSWFQPEIYGTTITTALANGTVFLRPFELQGDGMDVDQYMFQQLISSQLSSTLSFSGSVSAGNASSGTGSWGQSNTVLLFSRQNTNETNASFKSLVSYQSDTYFLGGGYSASVSWSTNVSSASVSVTTSGAVSFVSQIDSNGAVTTGSSATSGSMSFSSTSTNANSFSSSFIMSFQYNLVSNIRPMWVPGPGINVPAGEYWLGLIQSTATGSTNMSLQRPMLWASQGMLHYNASANNNYLEYGNANILASSNWRLGFGSYSASSNTTTNIPMTAITSMASNMSLYFAMMGYTK